ncbi:MAG: metal ABC transporter permease [Pseudomonadota bacterium]
MAIDAGSLIEALTFRAGYNSALVALGATMLGFAAGGAGAFVFLRKRALVSDAITHATLPGVALAFLAMVALGGDGRWLPGLLIGSAVSAAVGLYLVDWIVRTTRLSEDAAIGAVLSVFFGIGIVLLTVIQAVPAGRQAGLQSFLLGSTAGMLASEALLIAGAGALAGLIAFWFRRPMIAVAFDPGFAEAVGINSRRTDYAIMGLALIVTVVGLKIVGLILIVALLIIPPVTARFWTDKVDRLVFLSALFGGIAAYLGAAVSAAFADLPTGPLIVIAAFLLFAGSFLGSPKHGVLAAAIRWRQFQLKVHRRQGLLSLARGEPVFDRLTLSILRKAGFVRGDGVATGAGRAAASRALRDETRWTELRRLRADDPVLSYYDGVTGLDDLLTEDQLAIIDQRVAKPEAVS